MHRGNEDSTLARQHGKPGMLADVRQHKNFVRQPMSSADFLIGLNRFAEKD